MMKKVILTLIFCLSLFGCGNSTNTSVDFSNAVSIVLGSTITVDGVEISTDSSKDIYLANDIIYYEAGKDASYGEGLVKDEHTIEEANAHVVVHITKAGTYRLRGTLDKGQIFVDLGKDAEDDPNAVVTLVLDGVEITCDVAPGVLFYNVYESKDTTKAGANVYIMDNTINTVNGAYVAKIFKEDTNKKLHKYDGAFYSRMSMMIDGNSGVLNIQASNEGLDTEMHLTINGGVINIHAQNDGINTNEDDESIFTMNDGYLTVASGFGEEGDGIDSNGSIVINGGTVIAMPCNTSADGGLDSDLGIEIHGGTVLAFGQNGKVQQSSKQNYISGMIHGSMIEIKEHDTLLYSYTSEREYHNVMFSSDDLQKDGEYTINGKLCTINKHTGVGRPDRPFDQNFDPSQMPERFDPSQMPEGFDPSQMPKEGWDNIPMNFNDKQSK